MTVRSLDFLDLLFLARYRQGVLPLDSARFFTRGNPLGLVALFSYLNPRRNISTAVSTENGDSLMGQVFLREGETSARLTFLAPADKVNGLTPPLLDNLTKQAGEWGALHILAEVDEDSPGFKALRQAGFSMYAWQRVWKLPDFTGQTGENRWREAQEEDWPSVQSLQAQIVPAMLQPVENLAKQAAGLVCSPGNGLQAYVSLSTGPEGIWLQPLVPPDSICFSDHLVGLVRAITNGFRRPVYVCIRSYQAWLESALEELGAEAGTRQAVMVKRLAVSIKEPLMVTAGEKALIKPVAPVAHIASEEISGKK
jgi:hypothetical protein